ncbi:hypothetical protein Fuma_01737 [Fuerstiella marisgermanici]|uniref:Uncharacterized protein n=2 Tax=Fuerstiella marisgermanici TaxID=1891926 RepID=A0A1P8WDI9_9PLAN|nr:hypothetical protein Fuma_01737 [Fuerstiella marisgermanici]
MVLSEIAETAATMAFEDRAETGFVPLFPIRVRNMIFDESIKFDTPTDEVPRGWNPSLRQVQEWSQRIQAANDERNRRLKVEGQEVERGG